MSKQKNGASILYFFQSLQCWKEISCNNVSSFGHNIQEEYGPAGENQQNSHENNKILEKFIYEKHRIIG